MYGDTLTLNQQQADADGLGVNLRDVLTDRQQAMLLADHRQAGPTIAERADHFRRAVADEERHGVDIRDAMRAIGLSDPEGALAHVNEGHHEADAAIYADGDDVYLELERDAAFLTARDPSLSKVEAQRQARKRMSPAQYARWRGSMPDADGMECGDNRDGYAPLTVASASRAMPGASRGLATGDPHWQPARAAGHAGMPGAARRLVGASRHDSL